MYSDELKVPNGYAIERRVFDSIAEMVEYGCQGTKVQYARPEFVGREFDSWASVKDAANSEWAEGLAMLTGAADEVRDAQLPQPKSRRRRTHWSDDNGDELCIDRLRSGREFWRSTRREQTRGPANVTLSIDLAAPCTKRSIDLMWRGAAAIILTELLERAGYRVELWGHSYGLQSYTDSSSCLLMARLKGLDEPLDSSSLVNATSGWLYRTAWFGCKANSHRGRWVTKGFGHPGRPGLPTISEITHDNDTKFVEGVFDKYAAIDLVRRQLRALQN